MNITLPINYVAGKLGKNTFFWKKNYTNENWQSSIDRKKSAICHALP